MQPVTHKLTSKTKLAMVPAVRAVFYLQEGKGKLTTEES
jgi:hypothetical protein